MTRQSQSHVRLQPPLCIGASPGLKGITIVPAKLDAGDDGLSAFLRARGRVFGIAYRILKNADDAEDIVQEVWIRWQTTNRSVVRDAAAFLATTARHLSINVIQSARSRRETSIAPVAEPVDISSRPDFEVEKNEALQSAVFALLERLSPAERAAYVLRKAFQYSYGEISKVLHREEANTRQLVTRAGRRIAEDRHAVVNSAERDCFLAVFAAAAQEGALTALESFLSGSPVPLFEEQVSNPGWIDDRRAHCDAPPSRIDGHCYHRTMQELRATGKPFAGQRLSESNSSMWRRRHIFTFNEGGMAGNSRQAGRCREVTKSARLLDFSKVRTALQPNCSIRKRKAR